MNLRLVNRLASRYNYRSGSGIFWFLCGIRLLSSQRLESDRHISTKVSTSKEVGVFLTLFHRILECLGGSEPRHFGRGNLDLGFCSRIQACTGLALSNNIIVSALLAQNVGQKGVG